MTRKIMYFLVLILIVSSLGIVVGQEKVDVVEATVCCEETMSGLFCQNVKATDCKPDSRQPPTSCSSTAFCNPGFCFDSDEGTCLDNTPQIVCNENGGSWSSERGPQCDLGCCILGDQASFVTLTRCKKLSGFYGLKTNYNSDIKDEGQCILTARADERGACVFEEDFEKTCEMTTRSACTIDSFKDTVPSDAGSGTSTIEDLSSVKEDTESSGTNEDGAGSGGENAGVSGSVIRRVSAQSDVLPGCEEKDGVQFCPGKLCSADDLGTNCGRTEDTTCLDGREEVYFVDTCGNPGNIYDKNKINDDIYWSEIVDKGESCGLDSNNENSQSCGNCNYLLGSYCRASDSDNANPTYGDNVCESLNCEDPETGKKRLHGESWCGFDVETDFEFRAVDEETQRVKNLLSEALGNLNTGSVGADFLGGDGAPVGSKYYRYLCNNGKVVTEPCADFRQEECIENTIETSAGDYSQAACRVNRWQDCTGQRNKQDCGNTDRRDCTWLDGIEYILMGTVLGISGGNSGAVTNPDGTVSSPSLDGGSLAGIDGRAEQAIQAYGGVENVPRGACVPKSPPGLNFWSGEEATGICAQANAICPVTYEKGLVGGDWKCSENCECLEEELELKRAQVCMSMGDCGPKVNIQGVKGRGVGYKITQKEAGDGE
jgi:hypothetical protein